MDQLFFVDVIDSASSGAAAHVRRKASLLEEVVGFDVTIVRLSFRHHPLDYIVVTWRLVARRASAGPTIDYARFSLATIPIIVVSLLLGNVVAA